MKRGNKKYISILEAILLITSIFAFAYAIGGSVPSVSAEEKECVAAGQDIWKLSGNEFRHVSGPSPVSYYSVDYFCGRKYPTLWDNGKIIGGFTCPKDAPETTEP